jgi:CPA1 family monovalent cation:H+ antiporter
VNDIESLIVLVAIAVALVRLADLVSIPYPIVLVLGGLGIGFIPGDPQFSLDPDVVFLVFLPPILQAAGFWSSPRELKSEAGPLSALVIGLTLTTMVVVAGVAQAVIPGLGWGESLVLGAIVAPTDPVAAIATFDRLRVSSRVALLVEGESMLNDATALVAYKVALAAVVTGTFAAGSAFGDLILSIAGGVAIGLAIAWLAERAYNRLDDPPLAILTGVLVGYASFALADAIGASGVLAAVSAGLFGGWRAPERINADLRLTAQAFWRVLIFTLNAILFILVGLQFPEVLRAVGAELSVGQIIGYGLLVSAVVIAVRVAWQFLPPLLGRLNERFREVDAGEDWRERLLIGWSGMRGAVSLAAALALPLELDSGAAFPSRDLIIYLTVAVILATLVGQGLTLPAVIRRLGLSTHEQWAPDEAVARLNAAQAALDRLDEIEATEAGVPENAVQRLRELYQARFARCVAALSGEDGEVPIEDPLKGYQRLRTELIDTERNTLIQMRNEGRVKNELFRRLETDLDLDEARLRS